jgi:hypothetical protein
MSSRALTMRASSSGSIRAAAMLCSPGDGERGVVAGGALHDDGDQLGVLARVVGAERPVDLLLRELQPADRVCHERPPAKDRPRARGRGSGPAARSRRAPEKGRGLSALLRSRSDVRSGRVSPAAGLMDFRCRT